MERILVQNERINSIRMYIVVRKIRVGWHRLPLRAFQPDVAKRGASPLRESNPLKRRNDRLPVIRMIRRLNIHLVLHRTILWMQQDPESFQYLTNRFEWFRPEYTYLPTELRRRPPRPNRNRALYRSERHRLRLLRSVAFELKSI